MRKRIGIILSYILVLCVLAGCKKPADEDVPKVTTTPVLSVTLTPPPIDITASLTVAPSQTTELPIYTINGDFTEVTAITALVSEEITEQVVTDAVADALADNAIYVKVNQVTRKGDVVTVDFSADAPPVTQVGASIEGLILDAFGQSLLDNVSGCNGVSFTVDGGNYASGHFEFNKDDIYMRR